MNLVVIVAIAGLAYTFRDFLKEMIKGKMKPVDVPQCRDKIESADPVFYMDSIGDLCRRYGVKTDETNALSNLLNLISRDAYRQLLKQFVDNGVDAEKVFFLMNNLIIQFPTFNFNHSVSGPIVTDHEIKTLLIQYGGEEVEGYSLQEQVRILINLAHANGSSEFKNRYGQQCEELLSLHEQGLSTEFVYQNLISMIRMNYKFISNK